MATNTIASNTDRILKSTSSTKESCRFNLFHLKADPKNFHLQAVCILSLLKKIHLFFFGPISLSLSLSKFFFSFLFFSFLLGLCFWVGGLVVSDRSVVFNVRRERNREGSVFLRNKVWSGPFWTRICRVGVFLVIL